MISLLWKDLHPNKVRHVTLQLSTIRFVACVARLTWSWSLFVRASAACLFVIVISHSSPSKFVVCNLYAVAPWFVTRTFRRVKRSVNLNVKSSPNCTPPWSRCAWQKHSCWESFSLLLHFRNVPLPSPDIICTLPWHVPVNV